MFALLIRLPGPIEKFAEHPGMVFEMKEQIGALHKVLSQLLILLQWFAAYFPEHFYIGTPGIPDCKSSSSSPGGVHERKPYFTDEAEVQYRDREHQVAEDCFGLYNLSGLPGSEEISEEEFNQLVEEMYPIESCSGQLLGLTDYEVKIDTDETAEIRGQDIKPKEQAHARNGLGLVCSREEEGKKTAIAARWERFQDKHDFPGDVYKVFRRFIPQIGDKETDRLLQLALALFLPETLLKVRKHISLLRKSQTTTSESLPTWVCRTAIRCCGGYRPNHFSVRLLQWSVFQYIQTQRYIWDPASGRNPDREDIINQIALSRPIDVNSNAQDYNSTSLDQVKRKIQSWHDQGREWDSIVQAAGSGCVLIYLPDKTTLDSATPAVSATKYRNLTKEQAGLIIEMVRGTRQVPNTLFRDEDLFESFLFHRSPRKTYCLENLPDNQIRRGPIGQSAFEYLGTT